MSTKLSGVNSQVVHYSIDRTILVEELGDALGSGNDLSMKATELVPEEIHVTQPSVEYGADEEPNNPIEIVTEPHTLAPQTSTTDVDSYSIRADHLEVLSENKQTGAEILTPESESISVVELTQQPRADILGSSEKKVIPVDVEAETNQEVKLVEYSEVVLFNEGTITTPIETFIMNISEESEKQSNLEEQIEELAEALNIQVNVKNVREVTETFIATVNEVKQSIEATEEITEEQIEQLVTAAAELLNTLALEPIPENFMRLIVLTLGEEFAVKHHKLITDCMPDELGTHEHRVWLTMSNDDQSKDHPTLLGRIALRLGLSMNPA